MLGPPKVINPHHKGTPPYKSTKGYYCRILLAAGADPDAKTSKGRKALGVPTGNERADLVLMPTCLRLPHQ